MHEEICIGSRKPYMQIALTWLR